MTEADGTVAGRKPNRLRPFVWGGLAALLMIPLVAMQFTDEVQWGPASFVAMGVLLSLVGGGYELAIRLSDSLFYRFAMGIAVVVSFLLIWVNMAVGFIGDEDNPLNLLFGGVLAIEAVGALIVRFRPRGMALVMVATAVAQALVSAIGLAAGEDVPLPHTGVFVGLWLLSAGLFHYAGRPARV